MVWNGIENRMEWNENLGMEYIKDARIEWNGRFQE